MGKHVKTHEDRSQGEAAQQASKGSRSSTDLVIVLPDTASKAGTDAKPVPDRAHKLLWGLLIRFNVKIL